MTEDLLNTEEINEILFDAQNPQYANPFILNLDCKKTSIFRVSKDTGLILVNGNKWTGREHIDCRHSLTSRIPYWNKNGKIENPSKFNLSLAPISYLQIADQIFKPCNLNEKKNHRPADFEVYIGKATYRDIPEVEYTLVVYKSTKIIHSLFVSSNKKPFNKKKVLDLRQGWAYGSHDIMACIQTFIVPYYDSNNIEKFKVILRCDEISHTDKWYIQVNFDNGEPMLTTFIQSDYNPSMTSLQPRVSQLDFSNITWLEKIIAKMIQGKFEY